ncbi:hypothetical protein DY023_12080 [Microbacterium bovistercoris]|uniref:SbsA Ig-like domain-containing protein n=1 Tax=Microbacterium bovistercoris TaxID=2293570 RepID=A0A371NRZ9_9MICO|nr:hypothetical protein [Microbacterium bovistercoris]REJ04981.1 hypothetical protein DY023_12080 [Microbacterium bovistercoris]
MLAAVVGVLLLVGAGLTAASLLQGPRVAAVQVDPQQAIETSGSRVILTANQPLAEIDESQVTVEPAAPFTIDAAGRSVGIRFTVPLDDSTEYSVKVAGAERAGGGPSSDLETAFTTPDSQILLLQRSDGDDKIFTTDLTGENGVEVFRAPHILDFRATSSRLVVAVEEDGGSRLLVMNRDGTGQRELTLPGTGFVSTLQVSDRGDLVGYSYSDAELTETSGRESVLVTEPLSGHGEPRIVQVGGKDASIGDWQFVPDTSSLLFLDFEGALSVEDPTGDAGVQPMGTAAQILGVTRGTFTAIVERATGDIVELNLTDGSEQPMPATDPDYGLPTEVVPFPGGALQHVVQRDELGMPIGQSVITVDPDGAAKPVFEVGDDDAILQVCASPSGQYAAVTVTPDLTDNPYDELLMPLPKKIHTNLIDLRSGETLNTLNGFDVSWCHSGPQA